MLILNKEQITETVSVPDVLAAVEKAFLLQETNAFTMPGRMHSEHNGNTLLLMPAFAGGYFSTKLVSVFPNNRLKGLPIINGSVLLNDGETGMPLALMDGSIITGLRTGAVGALGLAYTSPKNISVLGLIGAGYQGFNQVLFAASVRNISTVNFYDPYLLNPDLFVQQLKKHLPHINFSRKNNAEDVVTNSEVIITATTSDSPVIPNNSALLEGKHYIGIGSYKPKMREYPDQLFELIDQVIVDTHHAVKESGDLSIPLSKGLVNNNQVFRLGQLMNKEIEVDTTRTTFFKSVGMALFDLLTAELIYKNALEKGIGTEVTF